MRKFKFVLILAAVSFLTIGVYTIFIQSIDESDFIVETIKGDPKQPEVRSVQAELYDQGLKNVDYNVGLDGHVEKTKDNLISGLFESPYNENGAPADFRRFIRSDYVLTLEQEGISYAMGTPDNDKWELQYWEESKQRVVKKIFPAPDEVRKLIETELSPYRRIGDDLYVSVQDYQTNSGTLLYKLNLKNDTIQKINLPYTSKKEVVILGIHDEMIVYRTLEYLNESDESTEKTYWSDGKTVQPLKALNSISANQTELSKDGTKLIVLEGDSDQSSWIIYDWASKKSEKHSMDIPLVTDKFGLGSYTELKDDLIYTANRIDDGVINIRIVDAVSERVLYEGNIKDKLKRKETSLNSLILN
ncbi:hypothetical protein [Exiguobacterium artemiae]|uniref:hypothetical protein n=1 Tax=Exiguobacterium artemiae TaxID=340145 RepID=UPI0029640530|nr:hypothetical protein [Exiguobacterium sibiricum]MDW2885933.1 hypothetical protein [Exiguobacterium sibiricum]